MIPVAAPRGGRKARSPAGDRDVAQIPPAQDNPGSGPEETNQTKKLDILIVLVNDALGGRGRDRVDLVEILLRRGARRAGKQGVQSFDGSGGRQPNDLGQRVPDVLNEVELTGAVGSGMRCNDLLSQRCARSREADDEDWPTCGAAPASPESDRLKRERLFDPINRARVHIGVVRQPSRGLLRRSETREPRPGVRLRGHSGLAVPWRTRGRSPGVPDHRSRSTHPWSGSRWPRGHDRSDGP